MEIIKPPCQAKDAIVFECNNLISFLEFMEVGNNKSQWEIYEIKNKIRAIDEIQNNIKDIQRDIVSTRSRLDDVEKSIYHHNLMILDLEMKTKLHIDVFFY